MNQNEKLFVLTLLLCCAHVAHAIDENTSYFYRFKNQRVQLTPAQTAAINQLAFFEEFVQDNEDDEDVYDEDTNEFIFDFDTILRPMHATFGRHLLRDDIEHFIATITRGSVTISDARKLINLLHLANFLGSNTIVQQCAQLLGQAVTQEMIREHFAGRNNLLTRMIEELPVDVQQLIIAPIVALDVYVKTVLQEETVVDLLAWTEPHLVLAWGGSLQSHHTDVHLLDLKEKRLIKTLPVSAALAHPIVLPDNRLAAWGFSRGLPPQLFVINIETGQVQSSQTHAAITRDAQQIAFVPPNSVAVAQIGGPIRLWNGGTLQPIGIIQLAQTAQKIAAVSDQKIASAEQNDPTIKIWNLADLATAPRRTLRTPNQTLEGHTKPVNPLVPVSDTVLISASNSEVKLWNLETEEVTAEFDGYGPTLLPDNRFAFARPDNTVVVRRFDAASQNIAQLPHSNKVEQLVPVPGDNNQLATRTSASVAKVWNLKTETALGTIGGCAHNLISLGMNQFAGITPDSKLFVWEFLSDLPFEQQLAVHFINGLPASALPASAQFPYLYKALREIDENLIDTLAKNRQILPQNQWPVPEVRRVEPGRRWRAKLFVVDGTQNERQLKIAYQRARTFVERTGDSSQQRALDDLAVRRWQAIAQGQQPEQQRTLTDYQRTKREYQQALKQMKRARSAAGVQQAYAQAQQLAAQLERTFLNSVEQEQEERFAAPAEYAEKMNKFHAARIGYKELSEQLPERLERNVELAKQVAGHVWTMRGLLPYRRITRRYAEQLTEKIVPRLHDLSIQSRDQRYPQDVHTQLGPAEQLIVFLLLLNGPHLAQQTQRLVYDILALRSVGLRGHRPIQKVEAVNETIRQLIATLKRLGETPAGQPVADLVAKIQRLVAAGYEQLTAVYDSVQNAAFQEGKEKILAALEKEFARMQAARSPRQVVSPRAARERERILQQLRQTVRVPEARPGRPPRRPRQPQQPLAQPAAPATPQRVRPTTPPRSPAVEQPPALLAQLRQKWEQLKERIKREVIGNPFVSELPEDIEAKAGQIISALKNINPTAGARLEATLQKVRERLRQTKQQIELQQRRTPAYNPFE